MNNVILTILGDDNTLPSFIVFRGKPNGTNKKKRLKVLSRVSSGDIYSICQEKSQNDAFTMIIYLKEIWFKPSIYKQTKEILLIMDRERSHFSNDVTNLFKKYIYIHFDTTNLKTIS